MDNLHESEHSRQRRIFWSAGRSEPSNIGACTTPVNSTFTQLWRFLAIRFLSSTVFASPLHYLPGWVMDPAVLPSDGRRKGLWQCRSVCTRGPVGRCVAVVGVVAVGDPACNTTSFSFIQTTDSFSDNGSLSCLMPLLRCVLISI